jgi:hypothetical protein
VWQSVNVHKHTPDQPYFTHSQGNIQVEKDEGVMY